MAYQFIRYNLRATKNIKIFQCICDCLLSCLRSPKCTLVSNAQCGIFTFLWIIFFIYISYFTQTLITLQICCVYFSVVLLLNNIGLLQMIYGTATVIRVCIFNTSMLCLHFCTKRNLFDQKRGCGWCKYEPCEPLRFSLCSPP